ncbi:MAG: ribosomal protein S18 acetylase RimI-like enzyme/adenylate kinase family enzyme [Bradymonadia bacterium]
MSIPASARRIAIVGNGGGGKSTLAAKVAGNRGLQWHEVDAVQFAPDGAPVEDLPILAEWASSAEWVIDGFGPWSDLVARFDRADVVVFVDHPLWVHNWLASRRQIDAELGLGRFGGRPNCDLRDLHRRMFETIDRVNRELRPKLLTHFESMSTPLVTLSGLESLEHACLAEAREEPRAPVADIRGATAADVPSLARLHTSFCEDQAGYKAEAQRNPAFDPFVYFRRRLGDKHRSTFVAVQQGEVVGFVDGMLFSKGVPAQKKLAFLRRPVEQPLHLPIVSGYLNNVYVAEKARRAGVAAALIGALGAWMRDEGASALYTDVSEGNGASVRMFESAGFRRVRNGMRWELGR